MIRWTVYLITLGVTASGAVSFGQQSDGDKPWSIYITNDNCPDYTWGFTEKQTRQAFADIVKSHLDEMQRSDAMSSENQDRYNMAVTQEALCFVERYPDRTDELIRRIREGRVYVSPYLCNSLWAFQSAEGLIRTFYPYRRLEREWGISTDCAHHIELPSLPWGVPTILAGCGFRNLTVPYLDYDSKFKELQVPPIFWHVGPDGSRVRVALDRWASSRANYTQGAAILKDTASIASEWLPHYRQLGDDYPLRAILACGTHGDINPESGNQARGFAERISNYNAHVDAAARLVNATYPQFWRVVEQAESAGPPLATVSGSFGHSWDLWPVSLAKYVAGSRVGERSFLAAEALLSTTSSPAREIDDATRRNLQRAEWCWTMLSDHAWNGTGEENQRHNAELRHHWSDDLQRLAQALALQGWMAAGVQPSTTDVTVFNSLSSPRQDLVRVKAPADVSHAVCDGQTQPTQVVREGGQDWLYFVAPRLQGFECRSWPLTRADPTPAEGRLIVTARGLESPYYRVVLDPVSGGIASLVHKATERELVTPGQSRTLCQTVFDDGQEHTLTDVTCTCVATGPVLARLEIRGNLDSMRVHTWVTVYAELDRVDFDIQVQKPTTTQQQRLCQLFPVLDKRAVVRIASAGAIVRPRPQPEGDLLPGADRHRFAVQEFANFSDDAVNVTLVPIDDFCLRLDLDVPAFEALGNDQNYREVSKGQNGETDFRFRYSLIARTGAFTSAEVVASALTAQSPLLCTQGRAQIAAPAWSVSVDPQRAVATCLKPADDPQAGGIILRLWEVAGQSGPATIRVAGIRQAILTDLLERDQSQIPMEDQRIVVDLPTCGYQTIRLIPR